jgi:hypothetical protein
MSMKEKKQKQSLDRIIKQSFAYQEEAETERLRRASENMMKWNKENLSPNGGKKPFVRTEPQQPKPRRHTRWLTKSNEE